MKTKIISSTKWCLCISLLLLFITSPTKAQEWEFVGLDSMVIKQLYVSGDTIWAGTSHRIGNQNKSGLYKSIDGGKIWIRLDEFIGNGHVSQLHVDKSNTNQLYIIKGLSAYGNSGILYKTTNGGGSWNLGQNITQNIIQWFGISPFNENEMYFIDAKLVPGGVINNLYKSQNAGLTWELLGPFPSSSHGNYLLFTFDLTDSMSLYVYDDNNLNNRYLFKSTDKGDTWIFVSTPPNTSNEVYTDQVIADRIYITPKPYASENGGLNWFEADSGFNVNGMYLSFYQDRYSGLVYILRTDGLYKSNNINIFWTKLEGSESLPIYFGPTGFYDDKNMNNIFIDSEINILYLGTAEGIYKTNSLTNVINIRDMDINFYLDQNYPNPFNSITHIKYIIPEQSFITIKVYDVLGNEITTLINEEKSAGEYQIQFNGNVLTSGVYFYVLTAVTENGLRIREGKKMLLIK